MAEQEKLVSGVAGAPAADPAAAETSPAAAATATAAAAPKAAEPPLPARNKYAQYEKRKKRMPAKVKALIALVVVAILGGGCWLLISRLMKADPSETPISTGMAMRGRLESFITGWGYSSPKEKADVGAKAVGTVTEIYIKPGDVVKTGDILFVLDPEDAKKELETARTDRDRALESYTQAQQAIANLTVKAPFSGRLVEAADLKAGEPVSEGTELGRLVDDSKMKLSLYFSYGYIEEVKAGMRATVSVPKSMSSLAGTVESVEKIRKVNEDGTVCFKVNILMDNPGALTEGMEATALIHGATDIAPYDMGSLEFLKTEKIYAKSGGDVTGSGIHQYYEYTQGQVMLTLENSSLSNTLSTNRKTYEAAQEKVDELEASIAESVQVSPINGQVMAVVISVGDKVSGSGTPLVTIADTSKMIIETQIDEMDISKVKVGMPVNITFEQTDGTQTITGEVLTVSFEAQTNNNGGGGGMGGNVAYFPATIGVDNPGNLLPGMGVQFTISAVLHEDCLMVPSSAIVYVEGGAAVYVRAETAGQYETVLDVPPESLPEGFIAVPVEIGIADEQNTEIKSGIAENTEVLLQQTGDPGYGGMGMKMATF